MQTRYARAAEQLAQATAFENHAELAASFAAAARAQDQATRLRLLVTVACLLLVLLLSGWLSRGLLRSLEELRATSASVAANWIPRSTPTRVTSWARWHDAPTRWRRACGA